MKVEVYGKPYDQTCQNAVGFLKSAKIKVKFFDTDKDYNLKKLVGITKDLQKNAEYSFKSLDRSPMPVVISSDTKEVLVGYSYNDASIYDNIRKYASGEELGDLIEKYPELKR